MSLFGNIMSNNSTKYVQQELITQSHLNVPVLPVGQTRVQREGSLIFDKQEGVFYVSNGTEWLAVVAVDENGDSIIALHRIQDEDGSTFVETQNALAPETVQFATGGTERMRLDTAVLNMLSGTEIRGETSDPGSDLTIRGGSGESGDSDGGTLNLFGGIPSGGGARGGINIRGGEDGINIITDNASSPAGDVVITAGDSTGPDQGGKVTIRTGDGSGDLGGDFNLTAGDGGGGRGGNVNLNSGEGSGDRGGDINLTCNNGVGGRGGMLVLTGGSSNNNIGGDIEFSTGTGGGGRGGDIVGTCSTGTGGRGGEVRFTASSSTTDSGGNIQLTAGASTGDIGGDVILTGGFSSADDGGDIRLEPGNATGADRSGHVRFGNGGSVTGIHLDFRQSGTPGPLVPDAGTVVLTGGNDCCGNIISVDAIFPTTSIVMTFSAKYEPGSTVLGVCTESGAGVVSSPRVLSSTSTTVTFALSVGILAGSGFSYYLFGI